MITGQVNKRLEVRRDPQVRRKLTHEDSIDIVGWEMIPRLDLT